jgi:arylformamidase
MVFINYPLAPFATLDEIVACCRKAMLWLHQNIEKFNGDPNHLFVAGHSAGGHLASMLMEEEWVQQNKVHFIKGVCALSGVFNLVPIQLSNLNTVLNMSKAMALRNSTVELIPANTCPLLLFVGADETDEFKSQSEELYNNWKSKNTNITFSQLPGINHFSIPETLIDESSPVHLAMRKLMAL